MAFGRCDGVINFTRREVKGKHRNPKTVEDVVRCEQDGRYPLDLFIGGKRVRVLLCESCVKVRGSRWTPTKARSVASV